VTDWTGLDWILLRRLAQLEHLAVLKIFNEHFQVKRIEEEIEPMA